jgi:hypothetical protein
VSHRASGGMDKRTVREGCFYPRARLLSISRVSWRSARARI